VIAVVSAVFFRRAVLILQEDVNIARGLVVDGNRPFFPHDKGSALWINCDTRLDVNI
jgi:hypothetical protein